MKITKSQLRQIIKEELNKELAEASEAEAQLRKRYKEISAKLDAGEELTSDEIAKIFSNAGDSVTLINADANYAAYKTANPFSTDTETEWKDMIKRNTDHLEIIKAYKKLDGTTSIWTNESFTDIDAAITKGKSLYA